MISTAVRKAESWWFGIAWEHETIVATAIGDTADEAGIALAGCLPRDSDARPDNDHPFAITTACLLARLEAGAGASPTVTLSRDYLSDPLRRIYTLAAAIPIGYVSTYGAIARAAHSEARPVGRAMATNPLYPIVPCHRVVGADFSLVGYGGRQDDRALNAKLGRLEAEARGYAETREVPVGRETLTIYPVEWVLRASRDADEKRRLEREQAAELERAEAMQLQLFG